MWEPIIFREFFFFNVCPLHGHVFVWFITSINYAGCSKSRRKNYLPSVRDMYMFFKSSSYTPIGLYIESSDQTNEWCIGFPRDLPTPPPSAISQSERGHNFGDSVKEYEPWKFDRFVERNAMLWEVLKSGTLYKSKWSSSRILYVFHSVNWNKLIFLSVR